MERDRRFAESLLVITDGNPRLIKAVRQRWPTVPRQRCIVHRIRNVLARIPNKDDQRIRKELNATIYTACLEEALSAARRFAQRFGGVHPSACEVLGTDLADSLTILRFPQHHWRRLRTSNTLERTFKEVRRRTRVIGRCPTERPALSLVCRAGRRIGEVAPRAHETAVARRHSRRSPAASHRAHRRQRP